MPFFIIESERTTWTKYLVEAEDEYDAITASDNWQYLGYIDGEETSSHVAQGPFDNEDELGSDINAYVYG